MNLATFGSIAITIATAGLALAVCGDTAKLTIADGTGTQPKWVEPHVTLIPTVNIGPARGWPAGTTPQAATDNMIWRVSAAP